MSRHGIYDPELGFIPDDDCTDEKPTKTNADKYFRNATDEELARFQSKHNPRNCPHSVCKHTEDSVSCYDCWLDWLKQEVRDD